jgi:tRNA (cmo5U34)-methyltransferase
MANPWDDPAHALEYLGRVDRLARKHEGDAVLVGDLSGVLPGRVLDLGCGDGRAADAVLAAFPGSTAVCADRSPTMLDAARARFAGRPEVRVEAVGLDEPLPADGALAGPFDAVVSSFAVHHVSDARKAALYAECVERLRPGGVFANLDIVASPTAALHERWRDEMGARDDPADRLCELAPQLEWLRWAGLDDVDCIWKWRSLALMRGQKPALLTDR